MVAVAPADTRGRTVRTLDAVVLDIAGPITIALIASLVPARPGFPGSHRVVERLFVERLYDVYQHPPTLSRHDRTDV